MQEKESIFEYEIRTKTNLSLGTLFGITLIIIAHDINVKHRPSEQICLSGPHTHGRVSSFASFSVQTRQCQKHLEYGITFKVIIIFSTNNQGSECNEMIYKANHFNRQPNQYLMPSVIYFGAKRLRFMTFLVKEFFQSQILYTTNDI